jgi:UDP-N-acetylglucosamine--N-acetylmuramyl-(pentapeptide) pyrophosphoryl-undecaprenol N-acetylglucosamine transferase
MSECIVFTGGGTAGHVFPALAVLDELASTWRGRVVWIGSTSGMERDILSRRGIPYYGIPAGKLRRYLALANFFDPFRTLAGFFASLAILRKERPRLVFSKGGYVTVAPLAAARLLGIPALTHESDLRPGLATRINARWSRNVLVSFPESAGLLEPAMRPKALHTGNPVRRDLLSGDPQRGRALFGCPPGRLLLLVLGGSRGSAFLNQAVTAGLAQLTAACFVVHQMGAAHFRQPAGPTGTEDGSGGIPADPAYRAGEPTRQPGEPTRQPGAPECRASAPAYHQVGFLEEELPHLLAAADLVLCRAGANTLWELAALGKPAVLVPLSGQSSRGDQIENARYFAERGAALMVTEEEAGGGRLVEAVLRLAADATARAEMGRRARELGRPEAAARIAELVLEAGALEPSA